MSTPGRGGIRGPAEGQGQGARPPRRPGWAARRDGLYRLLVCGSTSIEDLAGNELGDGTDALFDLEVMFSIEVPALGPVGLALLALLLALAGVRTLFQRP